MMIGSTDTLRGIYGGPARGVSPTTDMSHEGTSIGMLHTKAEDTIVPIKMSRPTI